MRLPLPTQSNDVLLETAFPFHFGMDLNHVVTRVGASLQKSHPHFKPGESIRELVVVDRPNVELSYDELMRRRNETFVLRLNITDLLLRGQLCPLDDEIVFLGTPWQASIESLDDLGLKISDFAMHDGLLDNLFAQQLRSAQLDNVQQMVAVVEEADADNQRLSQAEKALEHDLSAAGDFRVRFRDDGTILDVHSVRPDYLPVAVSEFIGQSILDMLPELRMPLVQARDWLKGSDQPFPFEYELQNGDRRYYFEGRVISALNGDFLVIARDVTDRRELSEQLRHQSLHDPLTQLPNRTLFRQELAKALGSQSHCAVMFLDLDDFKSINDTMGHAAGDEVLKAVADRLLAATQANEDTPARLGGDEFGVLLTNVDSPETARQEGERLIERICEPISLSGSRHFGLTGSIGVAVSHHSRNPDVLYRSADLAMYRAKRDRKNSVISFDPSMYDEFALRRQLKEELISGIDRREFVPFFQPIVDFESGLIHGWEALARWNHPSRGLLTPFHFVEAAEEFGLVIELGIQILEQSCLAMNRSASLSKSLHVNLSPIQIQRGDIVNDVKRILEQSQLSSNELTLEITETTLFGDIHHAEEVLHEIKSLGVQIALDDFGVGYSSLRYLERFPIDILKLDRSFVSQVDDPCCRGYRLIEPTIQLGRALDLQIVAEGIETPEQAAKMKDFGCHFAQGYFYGRPMPLCEAEKFLDAAGTVGVEPDAS